MEENTKEQENNSVTQNNNNGVNQYNMQSQQPNQNYQNYNGQQYGQQQYAQQPQINQYYIPQNNNSIPSQYKPISAWGYVGWDLLFSIPIVGFILLIIFACGGVDNVNLKKYARSKFCYLLLVAIILLIAFALGLFGAITYLDVVM